MTEFTAVAHRYLDTWNETDPAKRRGLIEEVFAGDATYTDPLGAVAGHEGLDGFIGGAQQQFAGLRFDLGGSVDGHHDIARFSWYLGPEGAPEPLAIGFDVVRVEDGKIKQVLGFLDKMPG
ncbi:nuclear transport factor 2 family protein [Amycolatopsis acidiphila]|uniref:Nuclear transport factor 2 family protein n=1 Tax=Amycolatopsis acidiphila TaxID=715473 RepID=A0A557ZPN5_9PSEU|nr:nuclear transport factor 2 family protein [Amycolatopsis acidiphila]TVT13983.1 nuclear transport factor 2 family protein [Amycolatopsis acidiphila]UIJ62825.1 nuclear transport factor 2 family protein [Amycolatopsis acidiphila]GHG64446.1 isomerase [Amycolatopsis acidiphila]